jgi:hypothetical protein
MNNLQTLYNKLKAGNIEVPDYNTFQQRYGNQKGMENLHAKLRAGNIEVPELNVFTSKYLNTSTNQNIVEPIQPQPNVNKPIEKEEDLNPFQKAKNFINKLAFSKEEKPENNSQEIIVKGLQDYKVNPNQNKPSTLKLTTAQELSEGFKPETSLITSVSDVFSKYKPKYKKSYTDINTIWESLFSEEKPLTNEDFINKNLNNRLNQITSSTLSGRPEAVKILKDELEKLKNIDVQKNLEINTIKSKNKSNNLHNLSPTESIKTINVLQNSISSLKEKKKNLQEENIVDKVPAVNPISYISSLYAAYQRKSATIEELNRKIKLGEQDLYFAKNFNVDLSKTLATIPENERIQTEAALDPELKNLLNSAKKLKDLQDETSITDLTKDLTGNKFKNIKVKGVTAEKNLENLYNGISDKARLRKDLLNETYKDNLQEFIAANNFQNLFNVNDEKFNQIIDNYELVKQNPQSLNKFFKDPTAAEKFKYIETNNDFQEIIKNNTLANTINDERVNYRLDNYLQNKKDSLNSLNYLKDLGENQQLAEDYLEQKAQESGILSLDNAKFLKSQLFEKGNRMKQFTKQMLGSLAVLSDFNEDVTEWGRKLKYSGDLWKMVNDPIDTQSLSPFSNAKWIQLKTVNNNDYEIAVDENNNAIDVKYNKFSIPVQGPIKDQIIDYYNKNKDILLKNAKPITDYDGGYTATAGYLASIVADEFAEEGPSLAGEFAAAYATRNLLGAGLTLTSKIPKLTNWANRLKNSEKFIKGYNKVSGSLIGYTSVIAEMEHAIDKKYKEAGLDPSIYNVGLTALGVATVAQYTPTMEKTFRKLGTDLAEGTFTKEATDIFINDIPKIVPLISENLKNIKNKKFKDYLLQKEVRNYALGRFLNNSIKILSPSFQGGAGEAFEETVLEPISQIITNNINASLTGNELYNKESLKDLGLLDPLTATISALVGGGLTFTGKGIEMAFDKSSIPIDSLQAAINNPTKFKSLLSAFINDQNESGRNITSEQYNNIVSTFDNLINNYNQTKQDFNLTSDFISQTDLDNPVIQNTLKTLKLNSEAFNTINGTKTLSNIILNNELINSKKEKNIQLLTESIGIPDNNNAKSITPFLDKNGLFDFNKYSEITGDTNIDPETSKIITNYNTAQAENLKLKNTLNLFSKNFAGIQSTYLNNYQDIITDNPDLTSPELSFFNNILKNKLYNQSINNQRIAQIEQELSEFETVEKDKTLKNELTQLKQTNSNIQTEIDYITSTYKKGYLETQNNLSALEQEYIYAKGSVDNLLESYITSDADTLTEKDEQELNKLIAVKSQKLSNLINAFKNANKKYNNGINVKTLRNKVLETKSKEGGSYNVITDKDFQEDLKKEIKGNKDSLQKIKRYKYLLNKFKTSSLTPEELNEFRKFNKTYDEQQVLKTVLPYFVSLTKEEIEIRLSNNTDLTLALFNNLVNLGYINFNRLGKNINPELMLTKVQNALIELNHNIALINSDRINEIKLFSKQNGALYVNTLIDKIELNNKKESIPTEESAVAIESDLPLTNSEFFENIKKPVIKATSKQQETLDLIEKNTIKRSNLSEDSITDNFYIINDKLYKVVTTVEEKETFSEDLTAENNVNNFLDNVGKIIFGNNNINETHKEEIFNTLINTFANKNVEIFINKESYNRLFNFLVTQRNNLVSQGYIFITDERILYSKYDGTNFTQNNPVVMPDNTVGIAGIMGIIGINPNGTVDIFDLKTISKNNNSYKQTKWPTQLGIYKTILEKIPSIKVDNLKVFKSAVGYNIFNLGNKIANLNFKVNSLENINFSQPIKEIVNKYLNIPSLVLTEPIPDTNIPLDNVLTPNTEVDIEGLPLEQDIQGIEDEMIGDFLSYSFGPDEVGFEYDPNDYPFIESEPIITEESLIPQEQTFVTDAKADIERRRQESINAIKQRPNETLFTAPYYKKGYNFKQLPTDSTMRTEAEEKEYYEILSKNNTLTDVSIQVKTREEAEKLINAKYDAELAALEGQTPAEFIVEPTAEESAKETSTQFISIEANKTNFQTNNIEYADEPNPNISSLKQYTQVKYTVFTDPETNQLNYQVEIFNNQDLNKLFKDSKTNVKKTFTKQELKNEFNKQGLFFTEKILDNQTNLLLTSKKETIPSYIFNNVLSQQTIKISDTINSTNYQSLIDKPGEIVLLDIKNDYTDKLNKDTEAKFRKNASLGIVVDNKLVAVIPALTNNQKDAQIRNQLTITKGDEGYIVQPLPIKIDKIMPGAMIFNQEKQPLKNFISNLPKGKPTVAFVNKSNNTKNLFDPITKKNVPISASNLTIGGVYLIIENPNQNPVIIPLNTPTLQEYLNSLQLENLEEEINLLKINLNNLLKFDQTKSLEQNYTSFVTQLNQLVTQFPDEEFLTQLFSVIPKTIISTDISSSQLIKFEKLRANFDIDSLFNYLLNTLINLNENTLNLYTVDVDATNLYADNNVIYSVITPTTTKDVITPPINNTSNFLKFYNNNKIC